MCCISYNLYKSIQSVLGGVGGAGCGWGVGWGGCGGGLGGQGENFRLQQFLFSGVGGGFDACFRGGFVQKWRSVSHDRPPPGPCSRLQIVGEAKVLFDVSLKKYR